MRLRPAPVASLVKRLLMVRRVTVETAQGRFKLDPELLPVIEENIRLNRIRNTKVANVAISDQSGTATLNLTFDTSPGGSGLYRPTKYALPTQEVEMLTLEQALDRAELHTVDLLKVDIEGFEYEAILGSRRVFQQHRVKALALELHPTILADRGKSAGKIERVLEQAGYRLTQKFGNTVWIANDVSNPELVR